MADEPKAPSMELEISVDSGSRTSADFSDPSKPVVSDGEARGVTLEFDTDGSVKNRSLALDAETGGEDGKPVVQKDETKETPEGEPQADLADYDPANAEVHKSYEDRFFSFDDAGKGTLNMPALEAAWEKNDGALPDGVYAFLTEATGISKEAIKEIEAGRVALREKADTELYAAAGGKEAYDTAYAWATGENGYTADQKARFNAAVQSNDPAVIKEAIELLKTRHTAATGGPSAPERRRASPQRSVTGASTPTAAGPAPYASNAEYRADAKAKGANNKEVRERLAASTFWRG